MQFVGSAPRSALTAKAVVASTALSGRAAGVSRCVVTFVMMIPVTLIVPTLKELVADRFAVGGAWSHAFMSVNLLAAALATPFLSRLLDGAGSRIRLAALALLLDAAAFVTMSLATSLPLLMLFRAIEGICHVFALTTLMTVAADHTTPATRGRVMGAIGASMMFGTAAGTRLGGVVWSNLPGRTLEIAAAFSLIAAIACVLLLREAPSTPKPPRDAGWDALRVLRGNRQLLPAYAYAFADRFCVGVIISSLVMYLALGHGQNPDERSRLLAMFMIPFALLVYPVGRFTDRIGVLPPLVLGSVLFGGLFGFYGAIPTAWLAPVMVLSGVLSAIMFAPTLTLCATLAPSGQRGAAYGGFNAAGSLGFMLGPVVGGLMLSALTPSIGEMGAYRAIFAVAGAILVFCALATLPTLRRALQAAYDA